MIRVLKDFCLVKIEKKYQDEIKTKSGIKLYVDTTFHPEQHVTMEGIVAAIPEKITDDYFETKGIIPDVEAGDKIYFNYLVVDDSNLIKIGEEIFYKVPYPQIFAYNRNGNIHMIGSWTFIRPYIEKREDKIGSLYLPEYMKAETRSDMGIVFKIGKPLKHEPELGLKEEDIVVFKKIAAFKHEIEGVKVYVMKQCYIMGKVAIS